jgi:hypothetical protein
VNVLLSVRSKPSSIVAAWTRVGVIAGACLGSIYGGAVIAGWTILPFGLCFGAILGTVVGLAAGSVNGTVIAALARPARLDMGTRAARLRAAAIAGVTTELLLLPVQLMNVDTLPLHIWNLLVIPPSVASVLVAAFFGLRLPPAGRVADRDAFVRIS